MSDSVTMVALRPHMDGSGVVQIGDTIVTHRWRGRELRSLGLAAYRSGSDDTLGESEDVETTDKSKPIELEPAGSADVKAAPAPPENKMRPAPANKATGPANSKGSA